MTQEADHHDGFTLPQDLEACHRLIEELLAAMRQKDAEYQRLTQQYEQLVRHMYGARRERFDDPNQKRLFQSEGEAIGEAIDLASQEAEQQVVIRKKKRGHGRRIFPIGTQRIRREHTLSEAERLCPCCGKLRKVIGQETSAQLDFVPGRYVIIEHVRLKYACDECEENVAIAPKPPQPIEKGIAASGLLAHVVTSKYTDHLPLYRQEEISDRHGWMIPRTTMCGWLRQTAATMTVLVALMTAQILRSRKIHTDDTPVKVIVPGERQTRQARFWLYCGDPAEAPFSVYNFTMNRSRDGPAEFLQGYEGYLQADGYGGYDGIAIQSDGRLMLVACGAHIRRKFYAQRTYAPEVACPALAYFRQLYRLERQWKPVSDEERYALRQEHAVPILEEFHAWLEEIEARVLPKSKIGEAVTYALNQWEAWMRYCQAGWLSIDNNLAERTIRPCTTGRKNWVFLGSESGGATAAILYSLTASAKGIGAHPYFYIRDMLDRLPVVIHDRRMLHHLVAACQSAPLTQVERHRLDKCERPSQYLDILRGHARALADRFLQDEIEVELVKPLSELLPDVWLAAHPEHQLELNRPTGVPVGLEA
jgi:transposase